MREKEAEKKKKEKKKNMPTVWFALKKSLDCKTEPSEVYDPKTNPNPKPRPNLGTILTGKKAAAAVTGGGSGRSGCSRSIANLKDVIHGSKRHLERPPSCSPRSIGSSEFLNPITHEVVLSNSTCELKITGFRGDGRSSDGFVGTLRPGTPGPGGRLRPPDVGGAPTGSASMKPEHDRQRSALSDAVFGERGFGGVGVGVGIHRSSSRAARSSRNHESGVGCHKCGEKFGRWEAVEEHHLSKHAVTELAEGDSSRKIVEIICKTSLMKSETKKVGRIERVLKVHNTQKTLSRFEEYRETVKAKAGKLPKKHPRCIADGNELLRFHGTSVACSLGLNGSSNLCSSEKCNVCRIIRHGFSTTDDGVGVFTTSTSGRAFECIEMDEEDGGAPEVRKALLVCRVIAGRVHRPLDDPQEAAGLSGFDSLAGKLGVYANIEELYLLNSRALLPCFVVICKQTSKP